MDRREARDRAERSVPVVLASDSERGLDRRAKRSLSVAPRADTTTRPNTVSSMAGSPTFETATNPPHQSEKLRTADRS